MRPLKINNNGFTIVELIVTIIVGSMLAGSTSMIVANQSRVSQLGRDVVISNSFAETRIESLRSAGFNNLTNGIADITAELPAELVQPRNASVEITDSSSGIKQVDLTITYNDQGEQRTFSYRTFIGELGVGQY
jgi:prepilin-type N-terminal cleavage/methylation domain-containing protein